MKHIVSLIAVLATMGYAATASAAVATPAGTEITNIANATFTVNGIPDESPSPPVVFRVDEILDVAVVGGDFERVTTDAPDNKDQPLKFTVTNTGNGIEQYILDVNLLLAGDQFNPEFPDSGTQIFIDNPNGTAAEIGVYDINDIPYDPVTTTGPNDPPDLTLDPGTSKVVFVIADIPLAPQSGDQAFVELTATAQTKLNVPNLATDPTGTIYPNQGDEGVDAIVGTDAAVAAAQGIYEVNELVINLDKEAEKIASARIANAVLGDVDLPNVVQVPGDTIRYRLTFTVAGDGVIKGVFVTDALPPEMTFKVGSIRVTVNSDPELTPTETASDSDGVFVGTIPLGQNFADEGENGIVFGLDSLLNLNGNGLVVTTGPPVVDYTIVFEFDMIIPDAVLVP